MARSLERLVRTWNLGKINYTNGLKLQEYVASLHIQNSDPIVKNTLLCLEHDPVYTVGLRTKDYGSDIENKLKKTGADFHRTNRGGLITFHGPGQLVVYPILNLKDFKPSIRWYVCHIEKTIIHLCKKFGIKAETSPDTGVWIGNNKICAIGIHGSRFITTHGLALNCKGVTSLTKELNRNVTVDEVIPELVDSFCKVFQCESLKISDNEVDYILKSIDYQKEDCLSKEVVNR
ncbi:putative lipoyltransferase 2, mitochondrial isoform X2 [Anthonomus grandis grandis]|uniref:putative lipoyltransferase 2, mitochondrial isoform X2 n=1 Tax=Anthonomus grandis grandis TaxID=2921223 RepID=UPI00216564A2|nr:putative lipoyltransferase 2, mitochondrial isoform X2 [Anthonomus grandis grandis]